MKFTPGTLVSAGVVVLACASTIAVLATRDVVSTSEREGREQNLLPSFRSEDVIRLELFAENQKVAIERTATAGGAASFRLVEPVREAADPATVDKFLSALGSARSLRPVEQGTPANMLGFSKPALRVRVQTPKRSYQLTLGGNAPTPAGARYVQLKLSADREPPAVVVVAKSVAEDLAVDLASFRLHGLAPVNEADVTRIGISSQKLNIRLERSTATSFVIAAEHGAKLLANRETLKTLFFQLSRLTASSFLSEPEAETGLGPARAHFEFELKDAKDTLRFDVGGSCPFDASKLVVVRRAPDIQRACAARELEATLGLEPDDFVDRRAFSLHTDEVEELDIAGGEHKFTLLRKGSGFVLQGSAETQVELEAGNQRIAELLEAEGERVPYELAKLNELGLDPASGSVTLRSSAARDADVVAQAVRVGKRDQAGNLLVLREQDRVVLRIPHGLSRGFAVDSSLLYQRKLTEFGLSSFISAEIEQAQGMQVLRRLNDGLQLEQPKGFDADGVLSSDLVQTLGSLTAERFVADRDDGTFGLQHSSLRVRFAFKAGDGTRVEHHLRFGDETALGVFASLEDEGPIFVLSRSVRDTCELSLINRAVFPTSSEVLKGITLEARGRSIRLARQGEHFTAIPAGSFPRERVPELLEALGNLRPEAALHSGAARPAEGFSAPSLTLLLSPKLGVPQTVSFGAGDSWRSTSVFYVRVSGVDATFVMAQSKVRALSDAL